MGRTSGCQCLTFLKSLSVFPPKRGHFLRGEPGRHKGSHHSSEDLRISRGIPVATLGLAAVGLDGIAAGPRPRKPIY